MRSDDASIEQFFKNQNHTPSARRNTFRGVQLDDVKRSDSYNDLRTRGVAGGDGLRSLIPSDMSWIRLGSGPPSDANRDQI